MDDTLQLTIRGIDSRTKSALVKKANQQGISLNRYVLRSLQQSADLDNGETRYLKLKQFLNSNKIDRKDKAAFDEALAWSDRVSIAKQNRD